MNPLWFVPAATFSLGAWQLSRLDWKIKLIEKASRRQLLAPETEIPELGIDGVDVENEFKRIKLDGEFLYDQEVFVGPRPRNDGATERDGTFRNTGFIVVTPFKSTSGETLLVNRGWLPSDWKSESISLFKNQIVAMEGFLRRGEPGSYFISSSIPSKGKWYTINTDLMSTHLKSSKVMIEMTKDAECNKKFEGRRQPLMRVPTATFRNQHLEYALTWFGLCACSTYMILKGRRGFVKPL